MLTGPFYKPSIFLRLNFTAGFFLPHNRADHPPRPVFNIQMPHVVTPAVGAKVEFTKDGSVHDAVVVGVSTAHSSTATIEVKGGRFDGLRTVAVYDAAARCDESWRYPGK